MSTLSLRPAECQQVRLWKGQGETERHRMRDTAQGLLLKYCDGESHTPPEMEAMAMQIIRCLSEWMGCSFVDNADTTFDIPSFWKRFQEGALGEISAVGQELIAYMEETVPGKDVGSLMIVDKVQGTPGDILEPQEDALAEKLLSETSENTSTDAIPQSPSNAVAKDDEHGIDQRHSSQESISSLSSPSRPGSPTADDDVISSRRTSLRRPANQVAHTSSSVTKYKRKRGNKASYNSGDAKRPKISLEVQPRELGKSFTVEHLHKTRLTFETVVERQPTPITKEQKHGLAALIFQHTLSSTGNIVHNVMALSVFKDVGVELASAPDTLADAPQEVRTFLQRAWSSQEEMAEDQFAAMKTCYMYYDSYAGLDRMIKKISSTPCDPDLAKWITSQVGERQSKQKHKSWLFDALACAGGLSRETNSNGDTPIRRYITKCYHTRIFLDFFGGPGVLALIVPPSTNKWGVITTSVARVGAKLLRSVMITEEMKLSIQPIHVLSRILNDHFIVELTACEWKKPSAKINLEPLVGELLASGFDILAADIKKSIADMPQSLNKTMLMLEYPTHDSEPLPDQRIIASSPFRQLDEDRSDKAVSLPGQVSDDGPTEDEKDSLQTRQHSADPEAVLVTTAEIREKGDPRPDGVGSPSSTDDGAKTTKSIAIALPVARTARTKLPAIQGSSEPGGRTLRSQKSRKVSISKEGTSPSPSGSIGNTPATEEVDANSEDTEYSMVDDALDDESDVAAETAAQLETESALR